MLESQRNDANAMAVKSTVAVSETDQYLAQWFTKMGKRDGAIRSATNVKIGEYAVFSAA